MIVCISCVNVVVSLPISVISLMFVGGLAMSLE